ncbi:hypothetical protein [Prosthecodimorpha hirschii]|uniref:hypothetical protein n=1 Tax=Prosthecodimorpha hirschii TaxID=665126 RepID=UPI001127D2AF|nr:hypothetical protein [Prosthecomicrobium hirschii]
MAGNYYVQKSQKLSIGERFAVGSVVVLLMCAIQTKEASFAKSLLAKYQVRNAAGHDRPVSRKSVIVMALGALVRTIKCLVEIPPEQNNRALIVLRDMATFILSWRLL